MNLSSLTGDSKPYETDEAEALEYTAQVASPFMHGEVKLVIGGRGLFVTALFDATEISYADMSALEFVDYAVTIRTFDGNFVFSRMGNWSRPFYDALCTKYNRAVLNALFVEGSPLLTARGEYHCGENGRTCRGVAPLLVYEDCVCILPPDTGARRIPLCFLTAVDNGDYELTLKLSDDKYAFCRMGYDTEPFVRTVEKQMRALRERTLAAVRELDPSLSPTQASTVSKLMPEGAAAPMGKLSLVAPSFVAMIEAKLSAGRAADSYKVFKELCDPAQIYVGFKKNTAFGAIPQSITDTDDENAGRDPFILWLIAPSPDGSACAVEFAGDFDDAAATFVYRFDGDFDSFAHKLNMALEAISFKREVISLTDAELMKPEYAHYRMAVQRNAALQFVRAGFAGRVIHSGAWKSKLEDLWSERSHAPVPTVPETVSSGRFCTSCGAGIHPCVKFCGQCGVKL